MLAATHYYHGVAKVAAQFVVDFSPLDRSALWKDAFAGLGPGGSLKIEIPLDLPWSSGELVVLNFLASISTTPDPFDLLTLRDVDRETRDQLLYALAVAVEGQKVQPVDETRIYSIINDTYHAERDTGGTMITSAQKSAARVVAYLGAR